MSFTCRFVIINLQVLLSNIATYHIIQRRVTVEVTHKREGGTNVSEDEGGTGGKKAPSVLVGIVRTIRTVFMVLVNLRQGLRKGGHEGYKAATEGQTCKKKYLLYRKNQTK